MHELRVVHDLLEVSDLADRERAAAVGGLERLPALFRQFCDSHNPCFRRRLLDIQQTVGGVARRDARKASAVQAAFDGLNMRMGVEADVDTGRAA